MFTVTVDRGFFFMDLNRPVGYESRKSYARRCINGFWDKYLAGPTVVDVGFRGGLADALPIVDGAYGIEQHSPGYDGLHLPFEDGKVDCVHSSHVLEHLNDRPAYLREWHRVLRIGGTMIIFVPHAYLYERRLTVPPSKWSPEHLCSFTPASLLALVESSLLPNSYRVKHLADEDTGYDYGLSSDQHPIGELEISLVLERIQPPSWSVER
jgi:SAM-dependent methyltransferase